MLALRSENGKGKSTTCPRAAAFNVCPRLALVQRAASGALGYGEFGGLMATVQSLMSITAAFIAFILRLPFQAVGWLLRRKLQQEITNERQHVLNQVHQFFHSLAN